MAENADEILRKLDEMMRSVARERHGSSMFAGNDIEKQVDRIMDADERYNEKVVQSINDSTNATSAQTKAYEKITKQTFKDLNIKKEINDLSDIIEGKEEVKAMNQVVAGLKSIGEGNGSYDTEEEVQAHLDKLGAVAERAGLNLKDMGVKIRKVNTLNGKVSKSHYILDDYLEVTEEITEEASKMGDAFNEASYRMGKYTEQTNAVRGALVKFGGIVKTLGKEFLRLGEDEARFAQQTATADAGFIKGVKDMGISQIEYMKVLKDTRVENLAMATAGMNFQQSLISSQQSLVGFTKNSEEAAQVAGKFHKNVAGMGVSQKDLGDAVAQQTSIYKENYRALGYTAEEFANLSAELINDQGMRSTILSLQDDERKAYVLGIQRRMAEYQTMGYTIERAKELNQTFQALNKMNPKERMKQAAKQRAMMGAMGMGAEGAELFDLQVRMRTMGGDEKLAAQKRITEINQQAAGKFGEMSGSGSSLGQSMAMQIMAEKTGFADVVDKFEVESGKGRVIDEKQLAKTNEVAEGIKKLLTTKDYLDAAKNSAVTSVGVGALGMLASAAGGALLTTIVGGLAKTMFKNFGFGAFGGGGAGAGGAGGGAGGSMGKLTKGLGVLTLAIGAWEVGSFIGDKITENLKEDPEEYAKLSDVIGGTWDTMMVNLFDSEESRARLKTNQEMKLQKGINEMQKKRDLAAAKKEDDVVQAKTKEGVSKSTVEEKISETLDGLLKFMQTNGEMTTEQTETMKQAVVGMKEQQRVDSLRGRTT